MSSSNSTKELITFKWTFTDFNGNSIRRDYISFPSNNQILFEPSCYPDYNIWEENYIMLYLYLYTSNKDPLKVRYRVSILNANGDKCETQERMANFSITSNRLFDGAFLWNRDYLLDPSNGLLVNGNVVTYWEIEEVEVEVGTGNRSTAQYDLIKMSQDYKSLLDSGKMADAVLVVGDKELPVHKLILSTRSPVFAAMFARDNTKESQENRVEITDVGLEVLKEMLKYIYIGKVESLDALGVDLLIAADKYQMDCLKAICEQSLCFTITTESVARLFYYADLHQANELRAKCLDYIADNGTQVMVTEGWKYILDKKNLMSIVIERMSHKISYLKSNQNK